MVCSWFSLSSNLRTVAAPDSVCRSETMTSWSGGAIAPRSLADGGGGLAPVVAATTTRLRRATRTKSVRAKVTFDIAQSSALLLSRALRLDQRESRLDH